MKLKIAIIVVGVAFSSCHQKQDYEQQAEGVAITSSDTIFVTSYRSSLEALRYPVKAIGKVQSVKRSKLIFERSGILETIHVFNGDQVHQGQVIANLKNQEEKYTLENAQIALKKALVDYKSEMLALGDSAYYLEKWERVKENVQLNTGVLTARVQLKQANHAYNQTFIHASQSGIIEGVRLREGDFINASTEMGSIYDASNYEVECMVLEYDLMKIKKGTEVLVYPLANGNMELKGTISEINPAVNDNGQSLVRVTLQSSKGMVPGLSVRVEINVTDEPTILVPMHAVVNRSERHVVFNVEEGKAKWNYVTLGKNNGKQVQILEGISEGMEIITSNNLQLAHDSPIKTEQQ